MYEFGRSMDSNKMESRDLLDAVPEKKYDCEPRQGSLLLNSGQLKRPTSLCRPSPDFGISRYSLASDIPETNCIKQHNLSSFIQSLGLISVTSLVVALLSLFILNTLIGVSRPCSELQVNSYYLHATQVAGLSNHSSQTHPAVQNETLWMASFAITSLIIAACLCCLLVCSMQCFLASKILKTCAGEERAHKFLRECSSSRILAVTGLFISIPIFIIDVALLLVLLIPHRQAIVSGLILGVGVLFCLLILIQNCYHWRLEKSRAESGLPVYDSYFSFPKGLHNSPRKQPELCTLV
ncbi:uncharacterized protein LOC106079629 isoform X1 [Biomphalaria glabrata]|uniref:Uncharacterized protein LOC106079629 isoform X1 n=1 Tax=Biomphalaria glabrata TaxID=6526 RepID=A0A9W2YQD3_BIOGL|nr:uncharacterized protein LOC106079629 isoform X1 [Biomphalaria glabrata]XP_055865017.1 uncharacterized protein LOC106079629 isoform X1 [Biomphalaria glabrata]